MPKVKLESGQIIEFDKTPTPEDIDFAIKQLRTETQLKQAIQPTQLTNTAGLPRYQEIEKRISERESNLPFFKAPFQKELLTPKEKLIGAPITALEGINLLSERGFAGIANPLMKMQEGTFNPITLAKETWKGWSGQRLGEMRDLYARLGVPDPIATLIGLENEIAISAAPFDKGIRNIFKTSAIKGSNFLKNMFIRPITKAGVKQMITEGATGLNDDLYKAISKKYDDFYTKLPNHAVDNEKFTQILDDLPDDILKKINKSKLITKTRSKVIEPTIENAKQIRGIFRKKVPEKIWNGKAIGDANTALLEQKYGELGSIMTESNPELANLNAQYKEFRQMQKTLNRYFYDADGNIVENKLIQLFGSGGEPAHKEMFMKNFASQYPKAKDIGKTLTSLERRIGIKNVAGQALKWGLIGAPILYGLRQIQQSIGESGGGEGTE